MEYIALEYLQNEGQIPDPYGQIGNNLPFARSALQFVPIKSAKHLTEGDNVKAVIELCLGITDIEIDYEPGDTIGILPQNDSNEVNSIIQRLNLIDKADNIIRLSVYTSTAKKNVSLPLHLPSVTTIRSLLCNNLDIRSAPKKLFLRMLNKFTVHLEEKRSLQEICEDSQKYLAFITQTPHLNQILEKFPSCQPPFERLLEYLPSLKPRPYSLTSSPLASNKEISFVFSVVKINSLVNGVCTSWMESLANKKKRSEDEIKIPIYWRKSNNFKLPKNPQTPLLMVGPGTGIAPFIGFIRHLRLLKEIAPLSCLYYGCKYSTRDFLYKDELQQYLDNKLLHKLYVAFSRETPQKMYVQNLIQQNETEFVTILLNKNATLYVCGDAKNMSKDVKMAVKNAIVNVKGVTEIEALDILKDLHKSCKYIEDVWM